MSDFETPILTMDLSWAEEGDQRVIRGCASIPQVDRENELVLSSAVADALDNFMALPVLHLDHTERPIGLVTSATMNPDGALMIQGTVKNTDDCDDVWSRIKSGELAQYSIYGRRVEGSKSCKLHPDRRDEPCKTLKLHLDSISVCPAGNAINPSTFVEIVKGIVVKSMNSESALIHETADGTKENIDMVENTEAPPAESAPDGDLMQQVVDAVTGMNDRLAALEQTVEEMTSVEPEDIEKADEDPDYDGAEEGYSDENPDIQEQVSTIAEGLTMVLQELAELKEQMGGGGEVQKAELEDEEYPDDGYEDDDYDEDDPGQGDEDEEEVEKGCKIKKAYDLPDEIRKAIAVIPQLNETIQQLQEDNDILRKAVLELEKTSPRDRKVIIDAKTVNEENIVKKSKTPETPSGNSMNPALLMAGQF